MSPPNATSPAPVLVGVDVGGTFTDAVVIAGGRVWTAKSPTTPDDQALGVMTAIADALAKAHLDPSDVTAFAHGMTVGTNALLEGTGAPIALVTTEGFADLVAIRRQDRAHLYRPNMHHPPPLAPRERRFEVIERCGPDGVLIPLDRASLAAAVEAVAASGVESVAVGCLFAFAHPEHERRIAEALRIALPHVHVSTSSDVLPEIREYERIATTCVDAHLTPVVGRYLHGLADRAAGAGLPAPVVMQSNGGVVDVATAAAHGSRTVLSGPAGGVIGAAHVARVLNEPRVLAFDMGGTSCDVALIDGEPARTSQTVVNGHPVNLPMLDIHTVSAGGGSIAWADSGGALRVGPQSAGAVPGPAAYGWGGTQPTVTDANVVLGRLDAGVHLSGGLVLDAARAEDAVFGLARTLDLDLAGCARGILDVAVAEMVRALRVVSVQRGIDPRGMALVGFGGAGPLHACAVAESLGMKRIVLPGGAGVLAAYGLIVAERRFDYVQTVLATLTSDADLGAPLEALIARAASDVPGATLTAQADCRYTGQAHSLTVPWDTGAPLTELRSAFHGAHETRYGTADRTRSVQVVSIRLAASIPTAASAPPAPPSDPPSTDGRFVLDGATGWCAPGWSYRHTDVAVVLER
jgi:N-methylhydantoinase A/oxoprolinase/acetone carboxylase beta subunit